MLFFYCRLDCLKYYDRDEINSEIRHLFKSHFEREKVTGERFIGILLDCGNSIWFAENKRSNDIIYAFKLFTDEDENLQILNDKFGDLVLVITVKPPMKNF